jgi:hypothetical protein
MIIEKHENGWSFTDETHKGLWHLAYTDDKVIALFLQSEQSISTSVNLFVGSNEECEQHIIDRNLIYEVMLADEEYFYEDTSITVPSIDDTVEYLDQGTIEV